MAVRVQPRRPVATFRLALEAREPSRHERVDELFGLEHRALEMFGDEVTHTRETVEVTAELGLMAA